MWIQPSPKLNQNLFTITTRFGSKTCFRGDSIIVRYHFSTRKLKSTLKPLKKHCLEAKNVFFVIVKMCCYNIMFSFTSAALQGPGPGHSRSSRAQAVKNHKIIDEDIKVVNVGLLKRKTWFGDKDLSSYICLVKPMILLKMINSLSKTVDFIKNNKFSY